MKKSVLALACAAATFGILSAAHADTVNLSTIQTSPTQLTVGEIGTADQTDSIVNPVSISNPNYYYFELVAPASNLTSYLGDLNTAGSVSSAIYQVSGNSLSQLSATGSGLTNSSYGGQGVVSTSFNLSPGTEYALSVTGQSGGSGGAVANIAISPAPEPATWALMVFGIGAIGVAMRHSRRAADVSLAAA